MRDKARRAYARIAGFLAELREKAEQLTRWQGGIESSAKRWGPSCKDAGFSRCASTRLEALPGVVNHPRSPAEYSSNCRI
ncbi:MAG: hypothetical protein ABSC06_26520 [Rhodopila sp.]|jgi:hypothetical protein